MRLYCCVSDLILAVFEIEQEAPILCLVFCVDVAVEIVQFDLDLIGYLLHLLLCH